MNLIRNEHVQAAANVLQEALGSLDRRWCEELALRALTAAREIDSQRGKKLARFVMVGDEGEQP